MGSPVRILHVVVNMNRGGAETLIMNLYRNIDRSKVQFDFLTCREGAFDQEIRQLGGEIHTIPYISDVGHFKYVQHLNTFFKKNQYKIVHSHMDKMSGLVLRAAKKAGVPIRISHSHNTQSEGGMAAKIYKWLSGKLIPSSATNLFACSTIAAEWLFQERAGFTQIIKNGIDANRFAFSTAIRNTVREELHIKEKSFVLGHVGRFSPQKNHFFLLELFAKFHEKYPDSLLLLAGDGPLRVPIEKRINELQLNEHVILMGIRDDIDRILHGFDVFVFPSLHEGLPVSLVEAQGAGLPCLIADTISREADLGLQLVQFLPLTNQQIWLENLVKIAGKPLIRAVSPRSIADRGYDIKDSADDLEQFYLQVSG